MSTVPFRVENDSIVISAVVDDQPVTFILDTGDAIGPVFTAQDAERLGLVAGQSFGVSGAGGESTSYETTSDVTFDDKTFKNEPSAIDMDLQGTSLLGLPFFYEKCLELRLNFADGKLTMVL